MACVFVCLLQDAEPQHAHAGQSGDHGSAFQPYYYVRVLVFE